MPSLCPCRTRFMPSTIRGAWLVSAPKKESEPPFGERRLTLRTYPVLRCRYGTPDVDGKWLHWNHKRIEHWKKARMRQPFAAFKQVADGSSSQRHDGRLIPPPRAAWALGTPAFVLPAGASRVVPDGRARSPRRHRGGLLSAGRAVQQQRPARPGAPDEAAADGRGGAHLSWPNVAVTRCAAQARGREVYRGPESGVLSSRERS